MEEIDSFFEDELADLNDMFEEFETKDKQTEAKRKKEQEELREKELKLNMEEVGLKNLPYYMYLIVVFPLRMCQYCLTQLKPQS